MCLGGTLGSEGFSATSPGAGACAFVTACLARTQERRVRSQRDSRRVRSKEADAAELMAMVRA